MVTLREVLNRFEHQSGTISLTGLARELQIEPPMLQEMIDYWVRKGRLREVADINCSTCGCSHGCPFVFALPRMYELVRDDGIEASAAPVCPHCGARR